MPESKFLTPEQLLQVQELTRITHTFRFLADTLKRNTLAIPKGKGKAEAKKWDTIAGLIERARMDYIAEALIHAGCELSQKATIDWTTGEITPIEE